MNIDLGKIVTALGEDAVADIGEPLGLSQDLSLKAARSLAENFTGNSAEAVAAAVKETGIGKDVLEAMITKLLDDAKAKAIDHVKAEATNAAKSMFGKFFGR